MPQLLLGYEWEDCPQALIGLLDEKYLGLDHPKAVLLFDYCSDLELLEQEYMKQNPKVVHVEICVIKFLPEEVLKMIKTKPFAWNMFTLLLAW